MCIMVIGKMKKRKKKIRNDKRMFDDAGIEELSKNCPKLRLLNVKGSNVTENCVIALAAGCTRLQYLNLHACKNVEVSAQEFRDSITKLKFLQFLNLRGVDSVTLDDVHFILENCKQLVNVHVIGCPKLPPAKQGYGYGNLISRKLIWTHWS